MESVALMGPPPVGNRRRSRFMLPLGDDVPLAAAPPESHECWPATSQRWVPHPVTVAAPRTRRAA